MIPCVIFIPAEDTHERTLTVDGEETTLVVMDTWEHDKLVQCFAVSPIIAY